MANSEKDKKNSDRVKKTVKESIRKAIQEATEKLNENIELIKSKEKQVA